MKAKWIGEQQGVYERLIEELRAWKVEETCICIVIKAKILYDLNKAIDWLNVGDFDTAYRCAGGASAALFDYQELLRK